MLDSTLFVSVVRKKKSQGMERLPKSLSTIENTVSVGNVESWHLKKEIWDGNRWSELQWFWNPESVWALPTRCVHCNIPISADHLINSPDCDRQGAFKSVECPVCFEIFEHCIKMAKGSPLNLALIGHFDG